jgi:KUP system potassium uptake protein
VPTRHGNPLPDGRPKVERVDAEQPARSLSRRRSLNEAQHKLSQATEPLAPSRPESGPGALEDSPGLQGQPLPTLEENRDVVATGGRLMLALGALGVVYGDIGTSPLYTVNVIFTADRRAAHATLPGVLGISSLIFWSLMIVVTIKYAGVIMRAHNHGDGGIMALTALVQRHRVAAGGMLVLLGIFGAALFFGDGMITPAISVLSAVEGLKVIDPSLGRLVLPIALVILVSLFVIQRRGTGSVGSLFGPVLLAWFACLALAGGAAVLRRPEVLQGLSPVWGARFMADHGVAAFLTLGGVVLAVTGAEALYADRGHFGAAPIRLSWLGLVLPALVLNYLGQGALILTHPADVSNPFLLLFPAWGRLPMTILATAATVIASQATITGSFSVARQAVQLGFLPRVRIRHTSEVEGQIYVPSVNWILAAGVVVLVLAFRSSDRLADIYGVAVTATFVLNTILFLSVARALWRTPRWRLVPFGALLLLVELSFFSANVVKIAHGAWLPLAVGVLFSGLMLTWRRGREIVSRNRSLSEGSLDDFLEELPRIKPPVVRMPGVAVFLSPGRDTTPLALRAEVKHNHLLQERVLIVSLDPVSVPRVPPERRFEMRWLGQGVWKVQHLTVHVGYRDKMDVPAALVLARKRGLLERNLDLEHCSYFVSRIFIRADGSSSMAQWRKRLFMAMARNSSSPIEHFQLPLERTIAMGSEIAL